MKTTFIINVATGALAGVVANVKNIELNDMLAVQKPEDLHGLSNSTLTTLFNNVTGETKSVFKTSKAQSAEKVFKALEAADPAKLIQLDKKEEEKVQKAAAAANAPELNADGTPVRKVRDSKLQRMAAAFREVDENGNYKQWTIEELMKRCGTTDKITHQYISILRAPSDRFVMPITKNKEAKTFQYTPKQA